MNTKPEPSSENHPDDRTGLTGTGHETRDFLSAPTPDGWDRFVRRYARRIRRWCAKRLYRDDEAEDLLQEIWLKLHQNIETFDYRKTSRFRHWLSHVKHSVWADFLSRHHRRNVLSRAGELEPDTSGDDSGVAELLDVMDLVNTAETLARERVSDIRWKVYQTRVHKGKSARETAIEMSLTPATVDNYFSDVRREVEAELRRLTSAD